MLQDKYKNSINKSNKFSQNYSPLLFRVANEDDLIYIDRLIQAHPEIMILDEIMSQLTELIKLRNPSKRLTDDEITHLINEHLGESNLEEYGVWVYYPWGNKLIHLLDEQEFIEVRTNRNKNKITKEEQDILGTKKVGVIGLSVGQSVAVTMAMERCFGEIRLADFDTLDVTNCNRIRTPLHNLGLSKALITAREIAEIDPFLKVVCFSQGITPENFDSYINDGGKLDLIVEECDSIDIKVLCRQKAKEFAIPVVMEMSDRGMLDIERYDLDPKLKMFQGNLDGMDLENLNNLTIQEKLTYLYPMVSAENFSVRLQESLLELGKTLSTWPQLASAVVLGGAIATKVVRKILLQQSFKSGRFYFDVEQILGE